MDLALILQEGGLLSGEHFQIRKVYGVDPWNEVLQMLNGTPYPSENNLATWQAAAQAKLDAQLAVSSARKGLKDKIALAKQYATEIKILYNTCLEQIENNTGNPNRYNNVLAVVNALPSALRNRVNTGTFDPASISTDTQRNAYVDHCLTVSTALAVLLSLEQGS
jgi:hypothetical protein